MWRAGRLFVPGAVDPAGLTQRCSATVAEGGDQTVQLEGDGSVVGGALDGQAVFDPVFFAAEIDAH